MTFRNHIILSQYTQLNFLTKKVRGYSYQDDDYDVVSSNSVIERTIHSIRVDFSLTIHKSQSLALPMAVIDLGVSERPFSITYVALSRFRRLEDLLTHCGAVRFEKIRMPNDILQ